ncbi:MULTISPECIES: DUF1330 domain-containing protein [Dactylosporangium]|uniref:DUF1330 domain-containing protein n=2 Tax=Dactylosporangium TaxID=35753 RepID=A0A9W6NM83_9ACTN|nr:MULTISPECIES: DUF1330 domain-containing protein [Dactylosporangium]UAB99282.1 DUF1330 domain-containing protein [Dactylosporangium vinaceum]UWZ47512.1 DUF1330 domain-containing protein [Dactylosporangium matsuzakiense]GLL01662.1 hypothetical protein GCM10017581_034040 [Dactylosporangium matsuzakiense]
MKGYALAHLYNRSTHDDVLDYLERIQGTLEPFEGRFLAHGPQVQVLEGEWPGTVVIIEFPDSDRARAWYTSDAYQAILRQRTDHIEGSAVIFDGVRDGHDPAKMAAAIRDAR